MTSAATRLVSNWANQGLSLRPGCPRTLLDEFETRNGFVLPGDLRELLELTNGSDQDAQGFSFWPLQDYESFTRRYAELVGYPGIEDSDRYYLFCDYLDWSWAYAIRLGRADEQGVPSHVVPIGMNQMFIIANSFSEFVDLYLSDSANLYPPE